MEILPAEVQSPLPPSIPVVTDNQVESLLTLAVDRGLPVESLEKLLSMRRELRAEYAKREFNKAKTLFQSKCPVIKKTKKWGGADGPSYAPLESIIEQVQELLGECGFSFLILTEYVQEEGVEPLALVTCRLTHVEGHVEDTVFPIPLLRKTGMMNNTHQLAGTFTYGKRYAFCNALGIMTGDEDRDGREYKVELVSSVTLLRMRKLLQDLGFSESTVCERTGVEALEDLDEVRAQTILQRLEKTMEMREEKK